MPAPATVCDWVRDRPEFAERYARARSVGLDALADELLEIADTPAIGIKTKADADGVIIEATTGDMIEHRKLRVDARKWLLSKMRPDKYGDRQTTILTDADGGSIIPALRAIIQE
jgi:hypothetical protein